MTDLPKPATPANDPFFSPEGVETTWNAYVGLQSSEHAYVAGYLEAAIELAAAVIEKRMIGSRDTLVMPILYNARHGVELALKSGLRKLIAVGFNLAPAGNHHDIVRLWSAFDPGKIGDEALKAVLVDLEPYVRSLGQMDEDGQEFRYPYRTDGGKSLDGQRLANLERIRASLAELEEQLSLFDLRVGQLMDERETGAHTSACSRRDLLEIARLLPAKAQWNSELFTAAKANIQARYVLSGREFSEALDLIQSNREMAVRVDVESSLLHLSDDKLLEVLAHWRELHPPRPKSDEPRTLTIGSLMRTSDILRDHKAERDALDALLALLDADELADLQALYYLGRNREFGEHYRADLERVKREHAVAQEPREALHHLLMKTNLSDMLAEGVTRAGRPGLASRIGAVGS